MAASSKVENPRPPCGYMVYTWALKWVYANPFAPYVFTIYLHRPFGKDDLSKRSSPVQLRIPELLEECSRSSPMCSPTVRPCINLLVHLGGGQNHGARSVFPWLCACHLVPPSACARKAYLYNISKLNSV